MKKFYEAPLAEELFADAEELLSSTPILSQGRDQSGEDLDWDLL